MKYSKSTRYALYAAMDMAQSPEPVTVGAVAARYRIPEGALARVMQTLVRAGIAQGVRGSGGGYLLVRPAAEVTVLDVIQVFDPARPEGHCLLSDARRPDCQDTPDCRLRRLFDEVDENARSTFASVSLETLVKRQSLVGR
ncbi:MAG: Rrf2 family transcriptional regulator [Planctomycetes bacterium]|nr:Rrf2 family transcriptional regulator [Planctomycetota bacterium]